MLVQESKHNQQGHKENLEVVQTYQMRTPRITDAMAATVRRNLKRFREELAAHLGQEFGQQDAAEVTEIPIDTYRAYEGGKRRITLAPLVKLAAVYGRPVEDFLLDVPPPLDPSRLPPPLVRFKAWGLDDDLRAQAATEIERVRRLQLDRVRAAKEKGRRGKRL